MKRRPSRRVRRDSSKLLRETVSVIVPFQDADPTGVAWHGNYFRYFDTARCALLERLNYGYRAMAESGYVWPIVDTRVRYLASVGYGAALTVCATLEEWEYRLRIGYEIHDGTGRRVTEAYTVQVPVDAASGEMCFGLPAAMRRRLAHSVREATGG